MRVVIIDDDGREYEGFEITPDGIRSATAVGLEVSAALVNARKAQEARRARINKTVDDIMNLGLALSLAQREEVCKGLLVDATKPCNAYPETLVHVGRDQACAGCKTGDNNGID